MQRSIIVTSNAFQIGGRETFVLSHVPFLKGNKTEIRLLTNQVSGYNLGAIFDDVMLVPRSPSGEMRKWLDIGTHLIKKNGTGLVWAQHFRLLPAWVMSLMLEVPFLATFHSPDIVMPGSRDPIESLGATLTLCRCGIITAVSEEVRQRILEFNHCANRVELMQNQVRVPITTASMPERSQLTIILLSRSEKLDHIRQGVRLFHHLREQAGQARLIVYSGMPHELRSSNRSPVSQIGTTMRRLGRKWLLKNMELLRDLPYIDFRPYIDDSATAIQNAHVVLGMGRVVLEGLSMGRPSVLIGYNEAIGLATEKRWAKYAFSNFSGRGLAASPLPQVAAEVLRALNDAPRLTTRLRTLLDVEVGAPKTSAILTTAMQSPVKSCDKELAEAISKILMSCTDDASAAREAVGLLNSEEQNVYARLMSC